MASSNKFPKKGEIWLVDYTANFNEIFGIESKIKKIRPSLILSNDIQNEYSNDILVAPITSVEINNIELAELLIKSNKECGLDKDSKALIYIIRTVDKKFRLKNLIGKISAEELKKAEDVVRLVFDV
ncbi:MAG: Endoribonuclease MazF [Mycoplasmataceae bacterium]|nr:MAG: Endoribonuclease MazF [Mycoplasmataceae bacterium]